MVIIKRFLDFSISLVSIIILSPLMVLVAILVKLTSKGPVLFRQRRVGKDNKEFWILKYRSMRTDTPNVATHLLNDPNKFITPIGRFLRKTSLDELPQLINILKGEMAIVGPRPALFNQEDLNEARTKLGVHKILPGLTGWAQINGRDELSTEEKVKFDKEYLDNQSLLFDIKIVVLTVIKVLKNEGVVEGSNPNQNPTK